MRTYIERLFLAGLFCLTACDPSTSTESEASRSAGISDENGPGAARPQFDAFAASKGSGSQSFAKVRNSHSELIRTGTQVQLDERLGVPNFLMAAPTASRVPNQFALKPGTRRPNAVEVARAHLARFEPLYSVAKGTFSTAVVRNVHDTGRGAVIVSFAQVLDGVEVFRNEMRVVMNRDLDLVALGGHLPQAGAPASFSLDAQAAVAAALSDFDPAAAQLGVTQAPQTKGAYQLFNLVPKSSNLLVKAIEPARTKRVLFELPDGLVPAHYVELNLSRAGVTVPDAYSYVISATDGRVLFRNNLTADANNPFTYRVWADTSGLKAPFDGPEGNTPTPLLSATNDGSNFPYVAQNDVTLSSTHGLTDPWLPAGATETNGNNVDAFANLVAPDGFGPGDLRADITGPGQFLRTHNPALLPDVDADQQKAAVTQLFYNVNYFHDWYYSSGFNERSGNAQASNYGRGGEEGDSIRAQAQDVSGVNNANMSTPSDGARPRMRMYLFNDNGDAKINVLTPVVATLSNVGAASFGLFRFSTPTAPIVPTLPPNGCTAMAEGSLDGKIAFIDRGVCGFAVKAANAEAAGAIGVIIANVASSTNPTVAPGMGNSIPPLTVGIGALSLNVADGDSFRAAFANPAPVTGSISTLQSLDGTLDNSVVAHEWGHFISNRLVSNANGLSSNMARGLGEGWADFHAMLMMVKETDRLVASNTTYNGTYAMGAYASKAMSKPFNTFYFGIRRYPYSTNQLKNPLSFRHIATGEPLPAGTGLPDGGALPDGGLVVPVNGGGDNAEVHNTGEVWASMLWECYAALLRDTLGGSPRLSFTQAQTRMKDYLVAAYKATPANPTLLEARDALLSVALVNDLHDYALFAAAFARRGAGIYAEAPDRFAPDNNPVVEDFSVGGALVPVNFVLSDLPTPVCNSDAVLDNGETGTLQVVLRNIGNTALNGASVTVSSSTPGITFPSGATVAAGATDINETTTVSIRIAAAGLTGITTADLNIAVSDVGTGPRNGSVSFLANYDDVSSRSATDDVESAKTVWQATSTAPASGNWQRIALSPSDHRYFGPNLGETADIALVSPPLNVGTGNFSISFNHRYSLEGSEEAYYDGAVIELSTNLGTSWTDIGELITAAEDGYNATLELGGENPLEGRRAFSGDSPDYPAFKAITIPLGTTYSGKTVLVRFRIGSDLGSAAQGWEIDDIAFDGLTDTPFPALVAQPLVCNNAPIAYAGTGFTVREFGAAPTYAPVTAALNGSGSLDPDGAPLTYAWTQVSGPAAVLSDAASVAPTFTVPQVPGAAPTTDLTFQLVVNDGTAKSQPSYVQVQVTNVNRPPVANAGTPQTVSEGSTVTLDGSSSADPDADDVLAYAWTQTAGPSVTLSAADSAAPTFTAPEVSTDTVITLSLTVTDSLNTSSTAATVDVTVHSMNHAPTAQAGTAQRVDERATVTLAGTGMDPDGDTLTYAWSQTAGPMVTLTGGNTATPSFTAPDVTAETTLTFSLVVSDSAPASSTPATVNVVVVNANRAPTANAGPAQMVGELVLVTLNGTESVDPDGDSLTYAWAQTAGASVVLSSATAAAPTFTSPDVDANTELSFSLVVTDSSNLASSVSAVTITIKSGNRSPSVSAGDPQTVNEKATVTLTGTATDPDGDALTYAWTQTAGPSAAITQATEATATFVAPEVSEETTLTFRVTATDALGASASATVDMKVQSVNQAPVANAGSSVAVTEDSSAALNGSKSSDPDGDKITYSWKQTEGTSVTLNNAKSATPTFTAPAAGQGTALKFELVVNDGALDSAPSTVMVFVTGKAGGCSTTGSPGFGSVGLWLVVGMVLFSRRRSTPTLS